MLTVCRSASRRAQVGFLLRVSQGQNLGVSWTRFLHGGSGEESISKLILIGGRIQFLEAVGLRFLFLCWLSSQGLLTIHRGQLHSFSGGPFLHLQTSGGWSPSHALTLCFSLLSFPSASSLRTCFTFRGACNVLLLTWSLSLFKIQLCLLTLHRHRSDITFTDSRA